MTNNKNFTKTILILLLLGLILFLIYGMKKENTIISLSSVSQSSPIDKKNIQQEVLKKPKNTNTFDLVAKNPKKQSLYKKYSYMDLYEKNILANNCRIVFKAEMDFDKKTDPYTALERKISYKSQGRQLKMSKQQRHVMSDFLRECKVLQQEVQPLIEKNHYQEKFEWVNPIVGYSFKRLYETKPDSEQALAIVDVERKLNIFGKITMSYGASVNGKSTLSREEQKQVNDEIKELNELMFPKINNHPRSQYDYLQDRERRKKLQDAIEQKHQYLKDSYFIDEEKLARYREKYAMYYPHIVRLLKTPYAYVFMKVQKPLSIPYNNHGENNYEKDKSKAYILKFYPQYQSIDDMIYHGLELKYRPYFDKIITPAKNLYLCYLGMDCSNTSRIMRNYCLGLNDFPIYQEACAKDLETFYYNDYLSYNQQRDVSLIFDFMVNHYAE